MSSMEQPISTLKKAERIPQGTTYVASMGDGSGTMRVSQDLLTQEVGKGLNLGDLLELMTVNKDSIVEAINELKGLIDDVDILDTSEEIEANTESGKAAGALAVKEMVSELNDKLTNNLGKIYRTTEYPNKNISAMTRLCTLTVPAGTYVVNASVASLTETYFSIGFSNQANELPRTSAQGRNAATIASANITKTQKYTSQTTIELWIDPSANLNVYEYLLEAIKIV